MKSSLPDFAGHYEVVIVGATPGGIACARRIAQEGRRVLLVEASNQIGGMWSSGIQVFDTRYSGHRCPFLSEFTSRLEQHYRSAYGEGSPEHLMAQFGDASRHGERPRFEPHVAESILLDLVRECRSLRLATGFRLGSVQKHESAIRELGFVGEETARGPVRVTGDIFVDATYEADLAAMAGAPFRVGREGREEFGEPHAGRHFTTIEPIGEPGRLAAEKLNLHYFNRTSRADFPASSGTGDSAVQAYTVRLTLTDVPENRRAIKRPDSYVRERYLGILDRGPEACAKGYPLSSHYLCGDIEEFHLSATIPNRKTDWIGANFVGANHGYPLGDAAARRNSYRAHVDHALGMMYFLQNDSGVPSQVREQIRGWGLARDEYVLNDNIPPAMYVREARRLRGLHIFTEHDGVRHPDHGRAPIRPDSVAFAEWPMDSHDCNPVRQPGSFNDGEFILAEQTVPSQIPYRCMICESVDNLLVPVCLSATHVGWGTLRLETVFVHTGEAAGVAAAICLRDNITPRRLDGTALQWELLRRNIAVAYFSDVDLGRDDDWTKEVQYLGSRGFFGEYAAKPQDSLNPAAGAAWQETLSGWLSGVADANVCGARVWRANRPGGAVADAHSAPDENMLALLRRGGWNGQLPGSVADAAHILFRALRTGERAALPL